MPDLHRLTTGLLFLSLVTFVMGSRPGGPRPACADEGHGAPPQHNEAALRDHPANVVASRRPSEIAFRQIFDEVGQTAPGKRDYARVLAEIHRLCEVYPGSDAAYRAIFAVEEWAKSGDISKAAAAELAEWKARFNPHEALLEQLQREAAAAIESRSTGDLEQIIDELKTISRQHPATESAYIALANVGPLLHETGDDDAALSAVKDFLDRYPYQTTDYPQVDHYTRMNLFLHARLLTRSRSAEEAVSAYRQIASTFAGREPFALPALYDAGTVALDHDQPELALKCFADLIDTYSDSSDSRVTLSRFRMAEAYLAMGDKAAARATAEKLAEDLPGTRWDREAKAFLTYLEQPPLPGKEYVPPDTPGAAVPSAPPRRSSVYPYVVVGNVLAAICIGVVAIARRRVRRE